MLLRVVARAGRDIQLGPGVRLFEVDRAGQPIPLHRQNSAHEFDAATAGAEVTEKMFEGNDWNLGSELADSRCLPAIDLNLTGGVRIPLVEVLGPQSGASRCGGADLRDPRAEPGGFRGAKALSPTAQSGLRRAISGSEVRSGLEHDGPGAFTCDHAIAIAVEGAGCLLR